MADADHTPGDEGPPPAAEELHLPGPSYLPVLVAAGVTIAITGIVISLPVTALGALLAVGAIARWIREAREEMSELPLEG